MYTLVTGVCVIHVQTMHYLFPIGHSLLSYAILKEGEVPKKKLIKPLVLKRYTSIISMDTRPCPHPFLFLQVFILALLFKELCSLSPSPLPWGWFLPSFLGRCGGGRTRRWKKASCQQSRSQIFYRVALWHFCQHLPVLFAKLYKEQSYFRKSLWSCCLRLGT